MTAALSPPPPCVAAGSADELADRLKNLLIFEEGRIVRNGLHVSYRDSKGIATIGYGFNLEDGGAAGVLRRVTAKTTADLIAKAAFLTEPEAQSLLLISEFVALKGVCRHFPRFRVIDLPRQIVLSAMVYQMGEARFGKFRRLIPAVQAQDWPAATASMEQSKWSRSDSPLRARRMAAAMRTGAFPPFARPSPPGQRFAALSAADGLDTATPTEPGAPPERKPWPFDNE